MNGPSWFFTATGGIAVIARFGGNSAWRKNAIGVIEKERRQAKLPKIICAMHPTRGLASLLDCRKDEPRKNTNNSNRD